MFFQQTKILANQDRTESAQQMLFTAEDLAQPVKPEPPPETAVTNSEDKPVVDEYFMRTHYEYNGHYLRLPYSDN